MVWPGLAILITALAFNLLGDGLRDAIDPALASRDRETANEEFPTDHAQLFVRGCVLVASWCFVTALLPCGAARQGRADPSEEEEGVLMRRKQMLSLFMLVMGVALLVAATTVGAAGSATHKAGAAGIVKGGTLRVNENTSDFDFVDPQLAYRTDDWSMLFTTAMQLVSFPEKSGAAGSQLYPQAATAFPTVSKDGKTYTFQIRSGLRFSDGSPVTAAAYQRAWERILSPKMGSPLGVNLDLQNVVVGGDAFLNGKAAAHLGHLGEGADADVPPDEAERDLRLDPLDAVVHRGEAEHGLLEPGSEHLSGRGPVLHREP